MQAVRAASLTPLAGETICNPISTPAPIVNGLNFSSLAPITKPVANPIAKAVTPSIVGDNRAVAFEITTGFDLIG